MFHANAANPTLFRPTDILHLREANEIQDSLSSPAVDEERFQGGGQPIQF